MVAAAVSPTDSASPDPVHNQVTYQEEMCEKLIQLSFVKIVSSKSERGGARLRKNLLILHLLQKARLEQRNRLFAAAAARNMVASQRVQTTTPVVNMETDGDQGRTDEIDVDASHSQQENIQEHPTPTPDEGETEETQADMLPHCDKHRRMHKDQSDSDQAPARQSPPVGEETEVDTPREGPSIPLDNTNKTMNNRRPCLKRKHDSSESSPNQRDWNSSPKMACVMRHRTSSESSSSNASSLNELFFFKTATPSSNDENGGQGETVAPLARSLSCSSFMELTCES